MPGFIGFGTSQSDLGYVPAVQGAEEIDSLVDADFRMVLRKLSKRDITTKLKVGVSFVPHNFFFIGKQYIFLRVGEEYVKVANTNFILANLLELQSRRYLGGLIKRSIAQC